MDNGRVIQDGSPEQTYFQPDTEFVADLFGTVNKLTGTVVDGSLVTTLGTFDAKDLEDGTVAQVLIRPEAFHFSVVGETPTAQSDDLPYRPVPLSAPPPDPGATITSARSLGRASLISFVVPTDNGDTELEARVPGIFLPEQGSRVTVTVNASQVHVFPLDDDG